MRVISGTFKGRKLIPPKGLTIRPTPDKVKEVYLIKRGGRGFSPENFVFIFLDPPYKSDLGEKALIEISSFNILKEDGEIIWEHYYKTPPLPPPLLKGGEGELQLKRTICYGDTALSFFSYH